MKKSLIIALGAIALVACTKTSVSYEQTGEIGLAPVTRVNTKAAVEGVAMPNDAILKVYGYYDAKAAAGTTWKEGQFSAYLNGVNFAKKAGDSNKWGGSPDPYYWPKSGSILFAAYTPASYSGVSHGVEEASGNDYFKVANAAQVADFSKSVDLLYANFVKSAFNSVVTMPFSHAFSWITINANDGDLADGATTPNFRIKRITFKGLVKEAKSDKLPIWTANATAGKDDFVIFSSAEANGKDVKKDPAEFANVEKSVFFFPQDLNNDDATLEIEYSMNKGNNEFVDQLFSAKFKTFTSGSPAETVTEWKPGKHYVYQVTFGRNEILIEPKLSNWDDVNMTGVPVK